MAQCCVHHAACPLTSLDLPLPRQLPGSPIQLGLASNPSLQPHHSLGCAFLDTVLSIERVFCRLPFPRGCSSLLLFGLHHLSPALLSASGRVLSASVWKLSPSTDNADLFALPQSGCGQARRGEEAEEREKSTWKFWEGVGIWSLRPKYERETVQTKGHYTSRIHICSEEEFQ